MIIEYIKLLKMAQPNISNQDVVNMLNNFGKNDSLETQNTNTLEATKDKDKSFEPEKNHKSSEPIKTKLKNTEKSSELNKTTKENQDKPNPDENEKSSKQIDKKKMNDILKKLNIQNGLRKNNKKSDESSEQKYLSLFSDDNAKNKKFDQTSHSTNSETRKKKKDATETEKSKPDEKEKIKPFTLKYWQPSFVVSMTTDNCSICQYSLQAKCIMCKSKYSSLGAESICLPIKGDCQHIFHEHCLNSWLKDNKTCPYCAETWKESRKINSD